MKKLLASVLLFVSTGWVLAQNCPTPPCLHLYAQAVGAGQSGGLAPAVGDVFYTDTTLGRIVPLRHPAAAGQCILSAISPNRIVWSSSCGGGGSTSPLTTLGDLWGFSTVDDRLPVGTDGFFLVANSGASLGVNWRAILGTDVPVFGPAGIDHAPGAVPDTNSSAALVPFYLGDDATWHPILHPLLGDYHNDTVTGAPGIVARGDLIYGNSAPLWDRLTIGSAGTCLTSDGTDVSWGTCGGGASSPLTTKGDLWGFSTVDARVPIGTNGQVLTADSTQSLGLNWATPTTGTVTSIATTAPITGGTITSTGTIGVSITTTNDGGAVVKQASTPGTAQTGHFNISGTATTNDHVQGIEAVTLGSGANHNVVISAEMAHVTGPLADWSITGIDASTAAIGLRRTIYNDTSLRFTIIDESASSLSDNRIRGPRNNDLELGPHSSCTFEYMDFGGGALKWAVIGFSGSIPGGSGTGSAGPVIRTDQWVGDGSTTAFAFTQTVATGGLVFVALNGSIEITSSYSATTSTLTMGAAPILNANLAAVYYTTLPASTTATQEDFTGDGTTTDFTLAHNYVSVQTAALNGLTGLTTSWSTVPPNKIRYVVAPILGASVSVSYTY